VFQNPFFPEVLRGISTGAHENKRAIYMSTGETEEEIFAEVVQMVQGRRVDGLILLYSKVDDQVLSYLQEQSVPFVVIGKPFKHSESITFVDNDNFKAGKEATEYLIESGHERIAFIGGSLELVVTIDRLTGYDKAIQKANIPYRDEYVIHEEFLQKGGKEAVCELLSLKERPTALVVADDLMALGVLNTLDEMGISVPEDISIVSFNNVLIAEMARPALTSIDINIFELGYQAVRCLIKQIETPYAVANMPGAVPRTSTLALTNVTVPYALQIANQGYKKACLKNPSLLQGQHCFPQEEMIFPPLPPILPNTSF
jgi:DNA-binding LacI/PurR family transcriptional regulator